MNIHELYNEIEKLRNELTKEYEKSLDEGSLNERVIQLSTELDKLIIEYIKLSK